VVCTFDSVLVALAAENGRYGQNFLAIPNGAILDGSLEPFFVESWHGIVFDGLAGISPRRLMRGE
jgi:hypothetical protein